MQNFILSSNSINNKIPYDIRSEVLFREAEDCFFYFSQTKKAVKKLDKALQYYPYHFKSLMLKGNIYFLNGKYDEALHLFIIASKIRCNNSEVLGSIANCLNELHSFNDALKMCEQALNRTFNEDLYSSLYELKIKILMNLRKYDDAKILLNTTFINSQENLVILKQIVSKTLKTKNDVKKRLRKTQLRAV